MIEMTPQPDPRPPEELPSPAAVLRITLQRDVRRNRLARLAAAIRRKPGADRPGQAR